MELQHINNAIERRNNSTATQTYSVSLPQDRAIVQAFEGKKIKDVDQMTLIAKLAKVMNMVGCPAPTKEQVVFLEDKIRKHYGIYTIDEFILAFEMNSTHKLSEKIDHYNVFSFDYVSNVMYLYTKKANEIRKYEKEPEEEKVIETAPIDIVESCFKYWIELKPEERTFERIHFGNRLFEAIQESGLKIWTKEDGEKAAKKAKELVYYNIGKMNMLSASQYKKEVSDPERWKTIRRQVGIALWFNEMIQEGKTTLK
jgi:transcription elongation factor Elf1